MRFALIIVTHFLVAVLAQQPAPYRLASRSINPAFGLAKRQEGYHPSQTICGTGSTCVAACGPSYVTCPSNDGSLHCYDPTIKETCCPDGTGNSCSDGYYCSQDTAGGTWCCPQGMSLAQCAAAYSITAGLVSETSMLPPPSASSAFSTSSSLSSSYGSSSTSSSAAPSIVYTTSTSTSASPPTSPTPSVSGSIPYPQGNLTSSAATLVITPVITPVIATTPVTTPANVTAPVVQYKGAASTNTRFWGLLGVLGMAGAFVAF